MTDIFTINDVDYHVTKLLGHGKSGYSYLVEDHNKVQYVVKKIHHEPIDYYTFADKFQTELDAYDFLIQLGLLMPQLIAHDRVQELIVKEFIDGETVYDLVKQDSDISDSLSKMREIAEVCKSKGINIDYFPTNFINKPEGLYYIDYEFNNYTQEWNFENWGINYWGKTNAFLEYLYKLSNQ